VPKQAEKKQWVCVLHAEEAVQIGDAHAVSRFLIAM
jgi:hypothetical protein